MTSAERRIELARNGIEAYDKGDLDAALGLLSPEIEVYSPPGTVNAGTYHGIEGFLEWTALWNEAWGSFEREIDRVEAVGERHTVAVVNQTGVGRESGVEVEQPAAYVFEIAEDERCSYFALYNDIDDGFNAAREREGVA